MSNRKEKEKRQKKLKNKTKKKKVSGRRQSKSARDRRRLQKLTSSLYFGGRGGKEGEKRRFKLGGKKEAQILLKAQRGAADRENRRPCRGKEKENFRSRKAQIYRARRIALSDLETGPVHAKEES